MITIAAARSRERLAVVAVESLRRSGEREPLRVVTHASRLAAEASPALAYEALAALSDASTPLNAGEEPRIVVLHDAVGTTVVEMLKDAKRHGRRDRWPVGVSVVGADGANYVSPNRLMARLYRDYHAARIVLPPDLPGLARLRAQLAAFAPKESKSGRLAWGDEQIAEYDDLVVALACATYVRGVGVERFIDQAGRVWPSQLVGLGLAGAAAR
jgi:hypothetical protein